MISVPPAAPVTTDAPSPCGTSPTNAEATTNAMDVLTVGAPSPRRTLNGSYWQSRPVCEACGWTSRLVVRDAQMTEIPCPACGVPLRFRPLQHVADEPREQAPMGRLGGSGTREHPQG